MSKVFTIGFTEKSAEEFFSLLKKTSAKKLIDVRLNKTSQLAGFAKREDLRYFLKEICNIEYVDVPDLAPEPGMLKDYRNKLIDWNRYELLYTELMAKRSVERRVDPSLITDGCLLCSEHKPHHCHRRIALEYLNSCWDNSLEVKHLF
jgi:uncharacterized protein (DUF488 family)